MPSLSRHRCLALLLVLMFGHLALTAHVATHVPVDQSACEFCGGHSNPAHAMVTAKTGFPASVAPRYSPGYSLPAVRSAQKRAYRQRAPPAYS